MLFISTPSLFISLVLAVFYIANLAVYAMNRQQHTEQSIELAHTIREPERFPQHTILPIVHQNDHQPLTDDHFQHLNRPLNFQFYSTAFHENASLSSIFDFQLLFLPDISPSIFDSGLCWEIFSRPPPAFS